MKLVLDDSIAGLSIPCDPLVLRDALECLVSNSHEANRADRDRNPLQLLISARLHESPSHSFECMVHLTVADNGPGVDDELRPYIFMDGVTSQIGSGRGRGLSTVKAQLTSFHGDLQLVNHPGERGATFEIRLGVPRRFRSHAQSNTNDATLDTR